MASAILMYFADRLSATFCACDDPVASLGWAGSGALKAT
jgi:hypothetical protein